MHDFFSMLVSEQHVLFAFSGYEMAHLSEMTEHDKQNTAFSVFGRNKTVSSDICETYHNVTEKSCHPISGVSEIYHKDYAFIAF